MSAYEKEHILTELRQYHLEEFPVFASEELNGFLEEFRDLEDIIINMLLSLVNGKAEYVDYSSKIDVFEPKLQTAAFQSPEGESAKKLFISKIALLRRFLEIAQSATFTLRKSYSNKTMGKQVTTTNTKNDN